MIDCPHGVANPGLAERVANDECVGFAASFEDDGRTLWVYSEDSGTPEDAATLVQEFLGRFRPDDTLGFEWANTCSRPLVEAFGGGAVFVTAEEQRWMGSGHWLAEQAAGPADGLARWNFQYAIRSLIDDGSRIVGEGRASVRVTPDIEPGAAAAEWVHENDYRADPRIQPVVDIVSLDKADR